MSDELEKIPDTRFKRASKIIGTGAKVGGNYLKHYAKKIVNLPTSQEELDAANAEDIYSTLSELKGSALKMAQMMSMDQQVLPKAYRDVFQRSLYDAPALSYPLVKQTITKQLGQSPDVLFSSFTKEAVHAASIGQVHKASYEGVDLAIKIQYPGVADAIRSDIRLLKPFALRMLNVKSEDIEPYLEEIQAKLLEETDYRLELKQGMEMQDIAREFPNIRVPNYYPALSNERVLSMEWIDGQLLPKFIANSTSEEQQRIGQELWDFFCYQLKVAGFVHADPHPGNFMVDNDQRLVLLDFGCMKRIDTSFQTAYLALLNPELLSNHEQRLEKLEKAGLISKNDNQATRELLNDRMTDALSLLARPFHTSEFDFGSVSYFEEINAMGEAFAKDSALRKVNAARGSKDSLYIMRSFFGIYQLLHQLGAKVKHNYPLG